MNSLSPIVFLSLLAFGYSRVPCAPRKFDQVDSVVCVCNVTYCDNLDPLKKTAKGVVTVFESSRDGDRLKETQLKFGSNTGSATKKHEVHIDRTKKFQKILGFGGAFTDASGFNIKALPEGLQQTLINDYFSESGLQYNLARIPIGGSDYSTRAYTYDDDHPGDYELKHWNLTKEDFDYKFPYLKSALKASPHLKLFGSPWSVPAWMKTNNKINNGGYLIGKPGGKEYKAFAHYIVKFIDAYKANGVPIWGITIDNEPKSGDVPNYGFNSLGFTPELQRDFLKMDLGPIMEAAGYGPNTTDIMIFDDQRTKIHIWAETILKDKDAAKYVSGTAFHWYENNDQNWINLEKTHTIDPTKYILNTEACGEPGGFGRWSLFERYAKDIIVDLNHWTVGWVDWNMALSEQHGPSWAKSANDAPIIVNPKNNEYYKQPMFYALGHFSKFLTPGSVRVTLTESTKSTNFESTSFVRPDGATVVIALNLSDDPIEFTLNDSNQKLSHLVKPRAMQTYIYYE